MTDSRTIAAARGDQARRPGLAGRPAPSAGGRGNVTGAGVSATGADDGATGAGDGATGPDVTAAGPPLLAIGSASRELGVSVRSLRYYEEMGLLTPSGRTIGGNRLYGPDDLARVRRIRELQQLLGFNLDEVRDILGHEDRLTRVRQDWVAASTEEQVRLLDEARDVYLNLRAHVEGKIKGLVSFRDELDARVARNDHLRETLPG
jgi:DNA-binding transcriptional MerR regulator